MTPRILAQFVIIPCLVRGNLWPVTLWVQCTEAYGLFYSIYGQNYGCQFQCLRHE